MNSPLYPLLSPHIMIQPRDHPLIRRNNKVDVFFKTSTLTIYRVGMT